MNKKWLAVLMTSVIVALTPLSVLAAPETMPDGILFEGVYDAAAYPEFAHPFLQAGKACMIKQNRNARVNLVDSKYINGTEIYRQMTAATIRNGKCISAKAYGNWEDWAYERNGVNVDYQTVFGYDPKICNNQYDVIRNMYINNGFPVNDFSNATIEVRVDGPTVYHYALVLEDVQCPILDRLMTREGVTQVKRKWVEIYVLYDSRNGQFFLGDCSAHIIYSNELGQNVNCNTIFDLR